MGRVTKQIAKLNTVDDPDVNNQDQQNDAELQMFSNTTFFDLDIGRSTDIATTVDELLMQQEKQIQYPHKQQPLDADFETGAPEAGPSFSQATEQPPRHPPSVTNNTAQVSLPFDFSTLQGFSLAGELPQASLSLYDVDPMFHDHHLTQPYPPNSQTVSTHAGNSHSSLQSQSLIQPHSSHSHLHQIPSHAVSSASLYDHQGNYTSARQKPVQRHELAEHYAPQSSTDHIDGVSGVNVDEDEKRRRNTAASARFRVKKKQREQEMEKNQRLMQRQISEQAERIKQLEMENSWLKSLVVEKNTARDTTSLGRLRSELLNKQSGSN